MKRSILAIVIAYALGAVLIYGVRDVFLFLLEDSINPEEGIPTYYYLVSIAIDAFFSIIAGWACASIAQKNVEKHAVILTVLAEITGIILAVRGWKGTPHWFFYTVLILCPIALLFGAKAHVWTRPVDVKESTYRRRRR